MIHCDGDVDSLCSVKPRKAAASRSSPAQGESFGERRGRTPKHELIRQPNLRPDTAIVLVNSSSAYT